MYNTVDSKCKKLWWESVDQLYGYHYKADTRIDFHAKHADITDPVEIVVSANDTDAAVIPVPNSLGGGQLSFFYFLFFFLQILSIY